MISSQLKKTMKITEHKIDGHTYILKDDGSEGEYPDIFRDIFENYVEMKRLLSNLEEDTSCLEYQRY
jgi:hypothetical protein